MANVKNAARKLEGFSRVQDNKSSRVQDDKKTRVQEENADAVK